MVVAVDQEEVWRRGLRARGKHWVMTELHRRAGRPDDALLEVVFEPPHPTRAFCQQWCAQEESRIRVSPSLILALVLTAVVVICVGEAVTGWGNRATEQQMQANSAARGSVAAAPARGAVGVTNDLPQPASAASSGTSQAAQPSLNNDPTSVCAYQTYATAACTVKQ
ncbi:MAG TPA: hypothetical protein VFL55_10005 [Acetobacteraceae bacterium]|nr:hypothetical protein [Acetobacteraceae bacterium]